MIERRMYQRIEVKPGVTVQLAGVGRRCLAMLIDQSLIYGFLSLVWLMFFLTLSYISHNTVPSAVMSAITGTVSFALFVFSVFLGVCYFWVMHSFNNGQTLGKRWMHIRLVRENGEPAEIGLCMVRAFFDLVDWMMCYGGVAVILMIVTHKQKRIADYVAGTLVVLDREPILAPNSVPQPG